MSKKYTIIIEKAENNYSAYCPALPGCIATGETVDEAVKNMREAILFHLEGLGAENISTPVIETITREIVV